MEQEFIDAKHWKNIDHEVFKARWPNFHPLEFASKDDGSLHISVDLLNRLQKLRDALGRPMVVLSGYRTIAHNRAVGGVKSSRHIYGDAADISVVNHNPAFFVQQARLLGFRGIGLYPPGYGTFIHLDLGGRRMWFQGDPLQAWGIEPRETMN